MPRLHPSPDVADPAAAPAAAQAPADRAAHEPPVAAELRACRLCADRFAATATAHAPRPVVWFARGARVLVASQAPGMRVHLSGRPFTAGAAGCPGLGAGAAAATLSDRTRAATAPTGSCLPGYDAAGADLPPPRLCAETWRARVLTDIAPEVTLLIGGHAIRWHLGLRDVTAAVAGWRDHAPRVWPLPHPSWRNTGWLKRNPWFAAELLPALQETLARTLDPRPAQTMPGETTR